MRFGRVCWGLRCLPMAPPRGLGFGEGADEGRTSCEAIQWRMESSLHLDNCGGIMKFANTGIRVIDMVDAAEDCGASPEEGGSADEVLRP